MNNLSRLPERAMQLASQVGDGLKDRVPDRALQWIETGAAIGALKSGTRVATRFVRRNPTVAIAAAAGAGLLWYAARRRAKQAERDEALEGSATRVDARRATKGNGGRRRTTTSARRGNASASDSTGAET